MNTITPVQAKVNLYNNQQIISKKQSHNPTFKGALGDKVVKQLVNKEKLTVAGILALTAGVIGLNKEKVSDVIESLVDKVNKLLSEKDLLKNEKEQLKKDLEASQNKNNKELEDAHKSLVYVNGIVESNKNVIAEKDAKIAELQKYEVMSKVKSVEEIGVVMPDEAIATLAEASANNKEAHDSLMNYLLTGKGQEEFLAQLDRNAILYKAHKEGIFDIPEVKDELNKKQYEYLPAVGNDPYYVACKMLGNCLKVQPKSSYIKSSAILEQIKTNAKALIEPMKQQERVNYATSVEAEIREALEFQERLAIGVKGFIANERLEYISETNDGISITQSYKTFKNDKGNFIDISLSALANGYFGCGRERNIDGQIIYDNSRLNQ